MDPQSLIARLAEREVGQVEELEQALAASPHVGPAEALARAGFPEWPVCQVLSEAYGLPLMHVDSGQLSRSTAGLISREVAEHHAILPLAVEAGELVLLMADPVDVMAEDVVRLATHLPVRRVLAPRAEILAALEEIYAEDRTVDEILGRIPVQELEFSPTPEEDEAEGLDDRYKSRPIIALVNAIIADAIRLGASDIHVEPRPACVQVRYRLDGVLRPVAELPRRVQSACVSRLKLMAGLDITQLRIPQDGRMQVHTQDRAVDLRVSTLPKLEGEKVVLRVLDRKRAHPRLEDIGLEPRALEALREALAAPQGMLLITGPTGSGKTSTLYAGLTSLDREARNVVTVEDPVEYALPGVNQVPIRPASGLTFSVALRAILRQDPDVVMVGEIRDSETARIATQAAQTGHLVLSTMHTNDAASALARLVQMEVPAYLVGGAVRCVAAQRLVRRLCPECRVPVEAQGEVARLLRAAPELELPASLYTSGGCDACSHTGYRGRLALFEVITITERLRSLILAGATAGELARAAREEGLVPLLHHGLAQVAAGLTSLEELLRVVEVERPGERRCGRCRRALQPDFAVCPYCSPGVTDYCGKCGHAVEPDWQTCPFCRAGLTPTVAAPPPQPPPAPAPRPQPAGPAVRPDLLVCSRDGALKQSLSGLLEARGWAATWTECPAATLQTAAVRRPRLLLADLATLEGQAAAFLAAWRSQLTTSVIPVVLLGTGQEWGADDTLSPAQAPESICARLARWLP